MNTSATYDRRPQHDDEYHDVGTVGVITPADVEKVVSEEISIVSGSCTMHRPLGSTTLFEVLDERGRPVLGRVSVSILPDETKVRVSWSVRILGWVTSFEPW